MGTCSGIGRETAWAAVGDTIAAVRAGATVSLGVFGEPGSGLTTFLRDVAARARSDLDVRTAEALDHPQRFGIALPLLSLSTHAVAVPPGGRGSFFEAGVSGAADAMAVETLLRLSAPMNGCRAKAGGPTAGAAKASRLAKPKKKTKKKRKRRTRKIFVDSNGGHRTNGRYADAVVRGTQWSVTDYCSSTRISVREGSVRVRDRVRKRWVIVKAGERYVARRSTKTR